ncbi:MAG: ABC transporter ATP-binding protein [Proteobacteria bacterium]|nr:ABC transporter ATP-binding protein [Pseudomonadota bacterium]
MSAQSKTNHSSSGSRAPKQGVVNKLKTLGFQLIPKNWHKEINNFYQLKPYLVGKNKMLFWLALCLAPALAGLQILLPLSLESAVNHGIVGQNAGALLKYSIFFCFAMIFSYLVRSGQAVCSIFVIQGVIKNLRNQLVSNVLRYKPAYHESTSSGRLLTRATNDFDGISDSISHGMLNSIVDLSVLIGSVIAMLFLDVRLALIGVMILPCCLFMISKVSQHVKKRMFKVKKKLGDLNGHTQESLYQHMAIKLLHGEKQSFAHHKKYNKQFRDAQINVVALDAFLYSFIEGLASITVGLTFWWLIRDSTGFADISPGVVVGFVQVLQQLFTPLKQFGDTINMLQDFLTSLDRILGLLRVGDYLEGKENLPKLEKQGAIEFKNVFFRYNTIVTPTDQISHTNQLSKSSQVPWNLENISFEMPFGSSLAIVGETGSGKSTIVKLLSKLYDNYQGTIRIGGHDLKKIDPFIIKKTVALVSQDITFFNETVAWNIHLGRQGITDDDVKRATKISGADSFIRSWQHGYDQMILESGFNISHGQKQMISLCRALCHNPEILILDEATSSVDTETEEVLRHVFQHVINNKTRIIIAHKLSTIKNADQIIVMNHGQLVEKGNHDSLLAQQGYYFDLIQARQKLEAKKQIIGAP